MTCRVAPPGSEEDKVMEQVRSMDPSFLEDNTSTSVGAATVTKIMLNKTHNGIPYQNSECPL